MPGRRAATLLVATATVLAFVGPAIRTDAGAASPPAVRGTYGQLESPRVVDVRNLRANDGSHPPRGHAFLPRDATQFEADKLAADQGRTGRHDNVRTITTAAPPRAQSSSRRNLAEIGSLSPAGLPPNGTFAAMSWAQQQAALGKSQAVEPPDTQIAAGPVNLLEMVNANASVWSKSGVLVAGPIDLNGLFGVPTGYSFSDPQVLYDTAIGRFVASGMAFNASDATQTYVAMSQTSDPAGTWFVYTIASAASPLIFDQPSLAVSTDKILVSWNDFQCNPSCTFQTPEIWVVDKAAVAAASSHPAVTTFKPGSSYFGIIPARELSATSTSYLLYLPKAPYWQSIGIVSINGPASSAQLSESQVRSHLGGGVPPNAAQPNGAPLLLTGDDRLQSAVWQNGIFWAAGNDGCWPGDTITRSCLRLISPPTSTRSLVDVDLGLKGADLFYPALAMDGGGNLSLVFNESSIQMYASVAAVYNPSILAPTVSPSAIVLQAGQGTYDSSKCGGTNRWGDYSSASVDPTDATQIWIAGGYAASASDSCAWGTAVTLRMPPPFVTGINPARGPNAGGTSIAVTGSGFSTTTSVTFGTVPASFTVNSDTSMTVVAPPKLDFVSASDIRVTNPSGTSPFTQATGFVYFWPTPVVTAVSPATGSAGGGDRLTITGTGLLGASYVYFGAPTAGAYTLVPREGFIANSDTQIVLVTPPWSPGTVDITVFSLGGYSAPVAADRFTFASPLGGAPGSISLVAGGGLGSGPATAIGQSPYALAFANGKLYLTEYSYGRANNGISAIRVIDPGSSTETIIGGGPTGFSGDGGPATSAQLNDPSGIAVDSSGVVYVADALNGRVRQVQNGVITTTAQLSYPTSVALDGAGNIYVADLPPTGPAIKKIDHTTHAVTTVFDSAATGSLGVPRGVAFDLSGNLLIATTSGQTVKSLNLSTLSLAVVAGGGTTLPTEGAAATSVQFKAPLGLVMDAGGSLFFVDSSDHRVWKVDAAGKIHLVAGNGTQGYSGDGGRATAASLNTPTGVSLDGSGGLYIADGLNQRIRHVDALGTISSTAGAGPRTAPAVALPCGSVGDGGPALAAQLCRPSGIVADAGGNLFIADVANNRIRKVATDGTISTIAGTGSPGGGGDGGPATAAGLNAPIKLALDGTGNLFVADSANHRIRKVDTTGKISTVAGTGVAGFSGDGGAAFQAQLNLPAGVALDRVGNLYIADAGNNRIRRVATDGTISTIAGSGPGAFSGDGGPATAASLNAPAGVVVDAAGNIYFADSGNLRIRRINSAGTITTVAGNGSSGFGGVMGPALQTGLTNPSDVAVRPASGNLLIAEDLGVLEVSPDGTFELIAGGGSAAWFTNGTSALTASLSPLGGIALGPGGNLYASDGFTSRIDIIRPAVSPGAPDTVTATTPGMGSVTVSWSWPYSGGIPITSYTVTPYVGSVAQAPTVVSATSPSGYTLPTTVSINGLKHNTYSFTVTAGNAAGSGPVSASSASVAVYTLAGPPLNVTAVPADGSATVSWSAPTDDGGQPITGYTVVTVAGIPSGVPVAGTVGAATTGVKVPRLMNGATYNFIVQAITGIGPGLSSSPSNLITPFTGGSYHSLPPARILDTRPIWQVGPYSTPFGSGESRNVTVIGVGGVPQTGVSAVVLNVTVTNTNSASYLTVFPAGVKQPLASNLNWVAGKTVPNLAEVAVGSNGQVTAFNAGGSVDVVMDVEGWVGVSANSTGRDGLFNPVVPLRLLDTRNGTGAPQAPVGAGQTIDVQVAGVPGTSVPATGVSGVVLNVTVTNPTAESYLTVFPTGVGRPLASNLNFIAGQTVPNRVIVKAGTGGKVSFYNPYGSVDVIADVGGWFTDATIAAGGSHYVGISPTRLLDTRNGIGPLPGGATGTVELTGKNANEISAVVVNVTVTNTTAASYLTLYPNYAAQPLASDLNWVAGQTVANLVVVKVSVNGLIGPNPVFNVFNAYGSTDIVMDLVGYYGIPTPPGQLQLAPLQWANSPWPQLTLPRTRERAGWGL